MNHSRGAALPLRLAVGLFMLGLGFGSPQRPGAEEVLRGQVRIDREPVYGRVVDVPYPTDADTVRRRALEESAFVYGGIIYGWSFSYDIGEVARKIPEQFEQQALGAIPFGDPRLSATDASVSGSYFFLWTEYRPSAEQLRRLEAWNAGTTRNTQAVGTGSPAGPIDPGDWMEGKRTALEDAARAAVRALLRSSERNRPKQAAGLIALAGFPRYWVDAGRWTVSARFRVQVTEVIPFAAY